MLKLDEAVKDWAVVDGWRIAPAGLSWMKKGCRLCVGNGCTIGDGCTIGEDSSIGGGSSIGVGSSDVVDIGFADNWRKCIAQVNGVAYIGAGCRWFTLARALEHWQNRPDREITLCLLRSAIFIADLRGWSHE
jgi:hypothetical protein